MEDLLKHHVACGLLAKQGRVLLVHRSASKRWYPSVWDFPGLSPWFWVVLGALVVGSAIVVSNLFLEWAPKWLMLVAALVPLAAAAYTFRMMWKQTDHPAFHGQGASGRPAPGDVESTKVEDSKAPDDESEAS